MSDWTEHSDPGSGRTYYYNASTGVTSWDPPEGWGAGAGAGAASGGWREFILLRIRDTLSDITRTISGTSAAATMTIRGPF